MTQNLILQTKKRPRNVKSVKTLGFYYKLRVGERSSGARPFGTLCSQRMGLGAGSEFDDEGDACYRRDAKTFVLWRSTPRPRPLPLQGRGERLRVVFAIY